MMQPTLQDLLHRIDTHKGTFIPTKQAYLDWVFRYNCRLIERFHMIPGDHPELLNKLMYDRIKETHDMVLNHYWKDTSVCEIYIPSVSSMDVLLDYDIANRHLSLPKEYQQ